MITEILTREQQSIVDKITSLEELPTSEEVKKVLGLFQNYDYAHNNPSLENICLIPTTELVQLLAEKIKELNANPIIEVCAGRGKLSYQLQKQGIDITPIDERSRYDFVDRLNHRQALLKYKPKLVLGAWLVPEDWKEKYGVWNDIIKFPSIKYFIEIGATEEQGNSNLTGSSIEMRKKLAKKEKRYSVESLQELEKHCYCLYQNNRAGNKHVTLITRK